MLKRLQRESKTLLFALAQITSRLYHTFANSLHVFLSQNMHTSALFDFEMDLRLNLCAKSPENVRFISPFSGVCVRRTPFRHYPDPETLCHCTNWWRVKTELSYNYLHSCSACCSPTERLKCQCLDSTRNEKTRTKRRKIQKILVFAQVFFSADFRCSFWLSLPAPSQHKTSYRYKTIIK